MSRYTQIGLALGLLVILGWAATKARTQVAGQPPPADLLPINKPPDDLGSISGRVTHDDGTPAAGIRVTAYAAVSPFLRYNTDNPNTAVTDADGRYSLVLVPYSPTVMNGPILFNGNGKGYKTGYTVFVGDARQSSIDPKMPYIQPPPQDVDPALRPDHVLALVDFVLRLGPQITVHAQDAITHAPISGVSVTGRNRISMSAAMGVTGPDGLLRFRVPDTQFELEAQLPGGVEVAPGTEVYHQVTASPGQEVPWDINVYDSMTAKNNWHGVVLGPNGRPASGVAVSILRPYDAATNLVTDAQGRFSALLYRMGVQEGPQKYNSRQPLIVARQRGLVAAQVVSPDESWDGMTLRLAPGASLSGTLTDPQGRPAAGVGVTLGGFYLDTAPVPSPPPGAVTDARGRFTLDGLPPGRYQVLIHGGGFNDLDVSATLPAPGAAQPGARIVLSGPMFVGAGPTVVPPGLTLAAEQHRDLGRLTLAHAGHALTRPATP